MKISKKSGISLYLLNTKIRITKISYDKIYLQHNYLHADADVTLELYSDVGAGNQREVRFE